ncbi:hypothetical protein DFH29DRAFT_63017 [Suillus ampliporus]|nr:hypothetical protein DFH29DRAFT_63017 [Suillus ampliporus]
MNRHHFLRCGSLYCMWSGTFSDPSNSAGGNWLSVEGLDIEWRCLRLVHLSVFAEDSSACNLPVVQSMCCYNTTCSFKCPPSLQFTRMCGITYNLRSRCAKKPLPLYIWITFITPQ